MFPKANQIKSTVIISLIWSFFAYCSFLSNEAENNRLLTWQCAFPIKSVQNLHRDSTLDWQRNVHVYDIMNAIFKQNGQKEKKNCP